MMWKFERIPDKDWRLVEQYFEAGDWAALSELYGRYGFPLQMCRSCHLTALLKSWTAYALEVRKEEA